MNATALSQAPSSRIADLETLGRKIAGEQALEAPAAVSWADYGYAVEDAIRRGKEMPQLADFVSQPAQKDNVLSLRGKTPEMAPTPPVKASQTQGKGWALWFMLGRFLTALAVFLTAVLRLTAEGLMLLAAMMREWAGDMAAERALKREERIQSK